MRIRSATLVAIAFIGALTSLRASAETFTAELGWVPIGGAERTEVSGQGAATATLTNTRLAIAGSFEGLPAKVTGAKLHQGVAMGARGAGKVVADLRITGDTRGTVNGDIQLTSEQVAALNAGQLYVQIYSEKGVLPDHDTLFGWLRLQR
jgi:hypothetical protein